MFITACGMSSQAQVDPHFSQYYVFPSWVNPALAGSFDGDYRVAAIYRGQWDKIAGGFKTIGAAADAVTNKHINIGLSLFQQTTGTGYTYQNGYVSVAYNGVRFGSGLTKVLSFGIQAGAVNRRFDASKFQTGDQWNTVTGYTPSTVSGDILANKASMAFDACAGVLYYDMSPTKKVNPYLGFSASHLTQPEGQFISTSADTKLPMRLTVHGGMAINVSEGLLINPNFLYLRQGNAEEKAIGAYAQLSPNDQVNLLGGINYRFDDAVVPFVGIDYKNLLIGVSYDVNNSELGRSITTANTYEVSLTYIFRKAKVLGQRNISCPRL